MYPQKWTNKIIFLYYFNCYIDVYLSGFYSVKLTWTFCLTKQPNNTEVILAF